MCSILSDCPGQRSPSGVALRFEDLQRSESIFYLSFRRLCLYNCALSSKLARPSDLAPKPTGDRNDVSSTYSIPLHSSNDHIAIMADATTNYVYTIGAYAALAGVSYAVYHVSTQKKKGAVSAKSSKSAQPEPRKEDRKKKQRMESFTSENHESSEKASKPKSTTKETAPSAPEKTSAAVTIKDDADDAEFAKQLAKAQQGKQFATGSESSKKKQKAKSVKQSRANNIDAPAEDKPTVQSASSPNGVEADDDQSATQSPVAEPADASGVADMLEPAAAAPSVLRLTETEPKDKKKKKVAKAAEPVETKKQRQNRKKAEAAKAAREEAEKERKVLEEKQRRAARIGEGRVAKDGSQYTNAAAAKSAWNQGAPNGTKTEASASNSTYALLDTVGDEVKDEPKIKKEAQQAPKPQPASTAQSSWSSSLPTEEEQIEMLKEEDEWSTVKSKASKRSARKETATSSGDEGPANAPAPAPAAPKTQQATTALQTPGSNHNMAKPKAPQNFGSFSALTSKDEPAEEVEEEWEV